MIGAGFAGAAHVEALHRIPRVRVTAIAASSSDRAAAAAGRLGVGRSTGDYRELIADPDIDVIHNCTPNDLHLEVNLAALQAGKHVLSEKPLGLDAGETGRLVAAAADASGTTGVCFNYRHYPMVAEVRERLGHGPAPHLVQGTYPEPEQDYGWSPGQPSEAAYVIDELALAWQATASALRWLATAIPPAHARHPRRRRR